MIALEPAGRAWIRPLTLDDEGLQRGSVAVGRLQDIDGQGLFGFVRRLGLSDEQADDAVQEVFTRLMTEYGRGILISDPRAWAYRAIYRVAMDEHRLRRRLSQLGLRMRREPADERPGLEDRLSVWAEVDRLADRQRQVIYLRYRSDLTFEVIGQILGITPSAARSHAAQAMASLRRRLGDEAASEDGS